MARIDPFLLTFYYLGYEGWHFRREKCSFSVLAPISVNIFGLRLEFQSISAMRTKKVAQRFTLTPTRRELSIMNIVGLRLSFKLIAQCQ